MDLETATDAVEAVFDAFGQNAKHLVGDPPGADCVVIPWRGGKSRMANGIHVAEFGIADRSIYILVRKSQVAEPLGGHVFLTETKRYDVAESAPVEHDENGLVWRCECSQGPLA